MGTRGSYYGNICELRDPWSDVWTVYCVSNIPARYNAVLVEPVAWSIDHVHLNSAETPWIDQGLDLKRCTYKLHTYEDNAGNQ